MQHNLRICFLWNVCCSYTETFRNFNTSFPNAFVGRSYASVLMTYNSAAEKGALREVWPRSRQLLCLFHVPQAVWRWVWSSHKVKATDRQRLMTLFLKVTFVTSVIVYDSNCPCWMQCKFLRLSVTITYICCPNLHTDFVPAFMKWFSWLWITLLHRLFTHYVLTDVCCSNELL